MLQMKAKEAIVAEIGSNRSKTYLEPCMICLSLVLNRGNAIEGAGEDEPITSAIDMRASAKARKKPAGVARTGAQNNKARTRPAHAFTNAGSAQGASLLDCLFAAIA